MKTFIYFVGVDEWNRPVFKCDSNKLYYCDTEHLFDYDVKENEIVEQYKRIGTSTICYKGTQFNSEPAVYDCEVEIVTKEHAKSIITDFEHGKMYIYERADEFPYGYYVWNIGRQNFPHEKCVPLAKDGYNPEYWMRNIDSNSLKYIEVESEELALLIIQRSNHCNKLDRDKFCEIVKEFKKNKQ